MHSITIKQKTAFINKTLIIELISYCFILLFIYAAVSKLLDFELFKVQLGQSPMLTAYANIIALVIPFTEIIICFLYIWEKAILLALYISFTLMVMFTAYIIIILNFSDYVPCSCGGIIEKMGWTEHIIFNILFILLALIGIVLKTKCNEHKNTSKPAYI